VSKTKRTPNKYIEREWEKKNKKEISNVRSFYCGSLCFKANQQQTKILLRNLLYKCTHLHHIQQLFFVTAVKKDEETQKGE
jgi:hypothetical protein